MGKLVGDGLPQARKENRLQKFNLVRGPTHELFGVNVCRVWLENPHAQSNFVI